MWASDVLYDEMREDQDYWIRKHYGGWEHLIRPCIDRAVSRRHTIQQIKAKFGTLRFYWTSGHIGGDEVKDLTMDKLVTEAEERSGATCTFCGLEHPEVIELRGQCRICKDGWMVRLGRKMGVNPHKWRPFCTCPECLEYIDEQNRKIE